VVRQLRRAIMRPSTLRYGAPIAMPPAFGVAKPESVSTTLGANVALNAVVASGNTLTVA